MPDPSDPSPSKDWQRKDKHKFGNALRSQSEGVLGFRGDQKPNFSTGYQHIFGSWEQWWAWKQLRFPVELSQRAKRDNTDWFSRWICKSHLSYWNGAFRELYLCYIPCSKIHHKTHIYSLRYRAWNCAIRCSKTTWTWTIWCRIATWELFKRSSFSCSAFSQRLLSLQSAIEPWEGHIHVQVCYNYSYHCFCATDRF